MKFKYYGDSIKDLQTPYTTVALTSEQYKHIYKAKRDFSNVTEYALVSE